MQKELAISWLVIYRNLYTIPISCIHITTLSSLYSHLRNIIFIKSRGRWRRRRIAKFHFHFWFIKCQKFLFHICMQPQCGCWIDFLQQQKKEFIRFPKFFVRRVKCFRKIYPIIAQINTVRWFIFCLCIYTS